MSGIHAHGPDGHPARRAGAVQAIWRLAGRDRRRLALGIAFRVLWAALIALAMVQLVVVVDEVRNGTLTSSDVVRISLVYAVLLAGEIAANYWSNRLSWVAAFDMGADVRLAALDRLERLPLGFHTDRAQGDTLTALTQDVVTVETFAHAPLPALVGAVTGPAAIAVALAFVDPRLAVVTVASVAAAVPVYLWANRVFAGLVLRRQDSQAEATGRIVEDVQGIAVVRAFNLGGERLGRFRAALDDLRRVNTRLAVLILPLATAAMTVVELGTPLLLAVGAWWLADGTVDAGTLVVFLVLALRIHQPLVHAADQLEQLRIADASLPRLARLLDEPEQPTPTVATARPADTAVRFDGVTFGYEAGHPDHPERVVLDGVDLDIPAGSMCAVVGPSGAGKTTLLNLVARFWDPQQGAVRIGGVDVRDLTAEQLYDLVTVVFQDVYLFPGTVRDNIAFGHPGATDDQVVAAATAAQAHGFVTALPQGYDTPVGEGGALLSGGERQRVSIARAILHDAPIVLLDEATAALDPTSERALQAALHELVRGKTLLVVAHRLATIRNADQIVVLDHGRVAERGAHDELLAADGLYARLWAERERAAGWRLGDARSPSVPVPVAAAEPEPAS